MQLSSGLQLMIWHVKDAMISGVKDAMISDVKDAMISDVKDAMISVVKDWHDDRVLILRTINVKLPFYNTVRSVKIHNATYAESNNHISKTIIGLSLF